MKYFYLRRYEVRETTQAFEEPLIREELHAAQTGLFNRQHIRSQGQLPYFGGDLNAI